jgi:ketosteroid isomerase-like protein
MIRMLTRALPMALLAIGSMTLSAQEAKPTGTETLTAVERSDPSAQQEIEEVMSSFHEAVVSHDGARLSSLFMPEGTLWLNVLTDEAYERMKAGYPAVQKVKAGSYQDFAKFVSTTTKTLDPRHSNVVIHTDGTVATVYFDFVFYIDGQPENRGNETWQLVKDVDGWKIASIAYSSDPQPHS